MKKLFGLAALLAAFAGFAVTAATADTARTARPFTGTLVGSATFPEDPSCPLTGRRTWSEASGTASHLGLVTLVSNHCTPPANEITGGQMTLVAANGDELHMTYSGTCTAPPFPPVGEVLTCSTDNVIVGGTGRFADATGEAQVTAYVTNAGFGAPEWPITFTWVGTLGY